MTSFRFATKLLSLSLLCASAALAQTGNGCPADVTEPADFECYYVDNAGADTANADCIGLDNPTGCCTGSGTGTCTCTTEDPCLSPNYVIDNHMTNMTEVNTGDSNSCTGACDQKLLIMNDGVYGYAAWAPTTAASPSVGWGVSYTTIALMDQASCSDCVFRASTLASTPTDADEAREIFQDMDGAGGIEFEPSVLIDCEGDFSFNNPTSAPSQDNWHVAPIVVTAGKWTIEGIASTCRVGLILDGGSNHTVRKNLFWSDTHNAENPGHIYVGNTSGVNISYNAFTSPGMEPWARAGLGDVVGGANNSPALAVVEGSSSITFTGNYFFGANVGPYHTTSSGITWQRNRIEHFFSHSFLAQETDNIQYINNIIGGTPYGRCADTTWHCVDATDSTRATAVGGATCTDNGADNNGDGIGDADCAATDYCRPDPWSISPKMCLVDADCSSIAETDIFPSSTAQFGGDSIPAAYSVASGSHWTGSTTCWHSVTYCLASNATAAYDGDQPVSHCGIMADSELNDGILDFASGALACTGGYCNVNGTESCSSPSDCEEAAPDGLRARYTRLDEPHCTTAQAPLEDDIIWINNTVVGYGYGIATVLDRRSAWKAATTCAAADCLLNGRFAYNNIYHDFAVGNINTSFYNIGQVGGAGGPSGVTATNWDFDNNAYGVGPSSWTKFTRDTTTTTDRFRPKVFQGWTGPSTNNYGYITILNPEDTEGICWDPAQSDLTKWHCFASGISCTTNACSNDATCDDGTYSDCAGACTAPCAGAGGNDDWDDWETESDWCDDCLFSSSMSTEFTDYDDDDLTPKAGSILIDAGRNTSFSSGESGTISIPTNDYFGNPRSDGSIDIGAIEVQPAGGGGGATVTLQGGSLKGASIQ